MAKKQSPYEGMYTAANNHYHGMKSVQEHGAIDHTYQLARVFLREGIARTQEEAVAMAYYEVQRLQWNVDGIQVNRMARNELRAHQTGPQGDPDPSWACS